MIRLEFIVLVTLGLAMGAAGSWWMSAHEEAVHTVSDCVVDRWSEHESRTGIMPTIEMEREWWKHCAESSNG